MFYPFQPKRAKKDAEPAVIYKVTWAEEPAQLT